MRLWIPMVIGFAAVLAWLAMQEKDLAGEEDHVALQNTDSDVMSQESKVDRAAVEQTAVVAAGEPVVQFPNGNRYDVNLRPLPEPPANLQPTVAGYVHELKVAAMGGNGAAAFQLHDLLASCEHAYRNQDKLEDAIQHMYETRSYPPEALGESGAPLRIDDARSLEAAERELRESAGNCATLDSADLATADDWLRLGAELDDALSLVVFASKAAPNVDDASNVVQALSAEEALRRAWSQGSVTALEHLSELYRPGSNSATPDPVLAYASRFLFDRLLRIQRAHLPDLPDDFPAPALVEQNERVLSDLMLQLRPSEVDSAVAIAEDMLRSNPNCCFDSF